MVSTKIKSAVRTFSRELKSISIVFYVLAIGIGMLFSYAKFARFGINIFHYSDVLDFLVIPFSDYRILVFTLLSILVVFGIYLLDRWWHRCFPVSYSKFYFGFDKKKWFTNTFRNALFLILFLLYLLNGADIYGSLVEKQIKKQPPIEIRFPGDEAILGKYIGKTKDVIFVLDENNHVKTIPLLSIKMYEIKQNR